MNLITKINGLSLLLCGVCMLILLNFLLSFWDYKSVNSSNFSRLSIRKVHRYAGVKNYSSSISMPPVVLARGEKPLTVISNNSSIPNLNSSKASATAVPQDIKYFTSAVLDEQNSSRQHTNSRMPNVSATSTYCIDSTEGGPISPNITLESLDEVEAQLGPLLKPGGVYTPLDCTPHHHVAIVVPFRDRYAHLAVFLRNIHPFLMQQHIAYRIFVVEQTNGKAFNRAALMNIGFLEALKIYQWDCFIFHDVDLLPLDSRNLYNCPRQPRHMSVAIDTFNFKLPYHSIFGGVSAMKREHFQAVNGFSNSFFGWGGEDDDMSNRLKGANLFISRYPINIARYTMLKHRKEKANPKRFENLMNGMVKMEMDGLNSIKYDIYSIKEFPIFTWYLAELKISDQNSQ